MKFLITGGTGFIGSNLVNSLIYDRHTVTILSRSKRKSSRRLVSFKQWDGKKMPVGIGLYDGVINLAGASLADARWTDAYKERIIDSRVNATRACVKYINACQVKPKVFLSGSAIGIYGGLCEEERDETGELGTDFMARVCQKWEDAAEGADCRTVKMRISVILGKGGALEKMLTPFKLGVGGRLGSGKQPFSWMHIDDLIKAMRLLLEDESFEGPINLSSPNWISQQVFAQTLGKALRRPSFMPLPRFMLDLMFGEMGIILWGGQKVVPAKLVDKGFNFQYPVLMDALKHLTS